MEIIRWNTYLSWHAMYKLKKHGKEEYISVLDLRVQLRKNCSQLLKYRKKGQITNARKYINSGTNVLGCNLSIEGRQIQGIFVQVISSHLSLGQSKH